MFTPQKQKHLVTKMIAIHMHFICEVYAKLELPVALWRQKHSDVKMKHEERVYNGVIISRTRVSDGAPPPPPPKKKKKKKIIVMFTRKTFTGDKNKKIKNSPSQAKFLCAWTSLNEYDPQ